MSKDELDLMFEAARTSPPRPSSDFLARVLSDGETMQPKPRAIAPAQKRSKRRNIFAAIQMIGGWPALAGMATAAVTGLWIGISPPELLRTPLDTAFGEAMLMPDAQDFGAGFDFTQFEG